jgi:hypothetical protein
MMVYVKFNRRKLSFYPKYSIKKALQTEYTGCAISLLCLALK